MAPVDEKKIELSIVVPVYRSQKILPDLVIEIQNVLRKEGLIGKFELLLVDDNSPDNSWQVITELAERHDFVRGILLRKNFGQHGAIMAGLNHVRGEVVIVMDDDFQHPPAEIINLMVAIRRGADVCYTRYKGRQHALWKKIGSRFNDWMATALLDKPKGLYLSSFKAMRREIADEVILYNGPYAYLDGLILDITRSIAVIDIQHQARREGEGNYNLRRSISLWMKMATSFSILPLRIATVLGFALAVLSIPMIVLVIYEKIMHPEIQAGWTSIIASILLVGGIQTFCIGMLGEYLGRAYLKLNGKPQFVVGLTTWARS